MTVFRVVPAAAPLGAHVFGIDLAAGVAADTVAALRDTLHRYGVVAIRDQRLADPGPMVSFCKQLGRVEGHVDTRHRVPGHPELIYISNVLDEKGEPLGLADAGRVWHTDGHFDPDPNRYSLLYAVEVPHADDGTPLGDTLFASAAHAWERLSPGEQARLAGRMTECSLAAIHRELKRRNPGLARLPLSPELAARVVTHPAGRAHPVTGRKAIYLASAATERVLGLPEDESRALIDAMQEHIIDPAFQYRHRWPVGDLLMWDNASVQHQASADYAWPQRRLMWRATLNREATS